MPSTAAAQHATTSRLIRGAITLLRERGVYTGSPGYVGDDDSLNIPAAILLAHTGKALPPAEFTRKACLAQWGDPDAYFRAHPSVMHTIRFLSACIDGQPNDDPATGEPDYIDHLAWWPTYRPIDAQTPPSLDDVLDVMAKAAKLAADIAQQGAPAPHATAA
ncbi:hypothetical protein ACH4TX_42140 [Streptomyces sp. NPDC021098]|uniref:hypothetical protein n=1 Tax=unclassified Streptomyces TaxID=2593676 RepID=UPI003787440D